ncbi:hypothetical protein JCM16138_24510 [Thermococcus atlanticus]
MNDVFYPVFFEPQSRRNYDLPVLDGVLSELLPHGFPAYPYVLPSITCGGLRYGVGDTSAVLQVAVSCIYDGFSRELRYVPP